MPSCSVSGCNSKTGKGSDIRMYRFPKKNEDMKQKWIENIHRVGWSPNETCRVCSKHFVDGCPTEENPLPTKLTSKEDIAESIITPKRRQRLLRKAEKERLLALERPTTSTIQKKPLPRPDPQSPEFSPSGAQIFYRGGGLTAKAPTPQTPPPYHHPNDRTPTTERRKQLASDERKRKRPKLHQDLEAAAALGRQPLDSPPFPRLEFAETAPRPRSVGETSAVFHSFLESISPALLDATFTDSDKEVASVLDKRSASLPVEEKKRGRKRKHMDRPHSSLGSLSETKVAKKLVNYRNECRELRERVAQLETELAVATKEKNFGWHRLRGDDQATISFTGFPSFIVMENVYTHRLMPEAEKLSLHPGAIAKRSRQRDLSPRNEFLLTMMRLRTGISIRQLAFIFGITEQYAGDVWKTWVPFLAEKMRFLINWIPRHERLRLPKAFRGLFKKCVAVLDCFELQIEKHSNMAIRQQMWSEYKQRHTAKFLVVMAPNGTIMFISPAWGGRISDVDIVQRSKEFLKQLNYGDELLADRGFRMVEWFSLTHHVYLRIPAFLKDGAFAMGETHRTQKLAKARIHVERCIGQLRNFKMLREGLPVHYFNYIDVIATVCAAICNLHKAIVTK